MPTQPNTLPSRDLDLHKLFEKHVLRFASRHTQRSYRNDWKKFVLEVERELDVVLAHPADLTEELFLAWLHSVEHAELELNQKARDKRQTSRRRQVACLSSFCGHLVRQNLLGSNPCDDLPLPPPSLQGHLRTEALNPEEMELLLDSVTKAKQQATTARESASADLREIVVWTLLTVGMRVGELCTLRICDVLHSPSGLQLSLSLKGGHDHSPFVHPMTAKKILRYIEMYRTPAKKEEPLFVRAHLSAGGRGALRKSSLRMTHLTQYGVYQIVRDSVQKAGIQKKISPHSLRASLATALILQGTPLLHVKNLLGHTSVDTTNIYLKRSQEEAEAATLQLDTQHMFDYHTKV